MQAYIRYTQPTPIFRGILKFNQKDTPNYVTSSQPADRYGHQERQHNRRFTREARAMNNDLPYGDMSKFFGKDEDHDDDFPQYADGDSRPPRVWKQ